MGKYIHFIMDLALLDNYSLNPDVQVSKLSPAAILAEVRCYQSLQNRTQVVK